MYHDQTRPSKYLLDKANTFSSTLEFFLSNEKSSKHKLIEKRLVFLAQIDFWEWEMETLIYSFANFKSRSMAWIGNPRDMVEKNKILVKDSVFEKISQGRHWTWDNETVAPFDVLNSCIEVWNRLLETCERTVMVDASEIDLLGADFVRNLDKYRKQLFSVED